MQVTFSHCIIVVTVHNNSERVDVTLDSTKR